MFWWCQRCIHFYLKKMIRERLHIRPPRSNFYQFCFKLPKHFWFLMDKMDYGRVLFIATVFTILNVKMQFTNAQTTSRIRIVGYGRLVFWEVFFCWNPLSCPTRLFFRKNLELDHLLHPTLLFFRKYSELDHLLSPTCWLYFLKKFEPYPFIIFYGKLQHQI